MQLRFSQSWNGYDRGQEVSFPHPGLAEDLIRLGIAVALPARPAAPPVPAAAAGRPPGPPPKPKRPR